MMGLELGGCCICGDSYGHRAQAETRNESEKKIVSFPSQSLLPCPRPHRSLLPIIPSLSDARAHLATSTPTLALVPILLACSLTLALASKLTTFDSDLVDFDLVATVPVDERVVGVLRRRRRD
jgi:hypothetical protein